MTPTLHETAQQANNTIINIIC